jgi:phosphate transport system protein
MATNRPRFEHNLEQLQSAVVEMARLVDKALQQAMTALQQANYQLSRFVIEQDQEINRRRFVIEEQALTLIATQQPVVAHDLRVVASVLSIVSELERMGDHARGIARINRLLGNQPGLKLPGELSEMAEIDHQMLESTVTAFIHEDAEAARKVAERDNDVDEGYDRVYHQLLDLMLKDTSLINGATYLLWAAHNLERFGDRLTNICERIIFISTGQMQEIKPLREERLTTTAGVEASAKLELEA